MKATLSNYRQSPRKVGLIAGLIRGKKVSDALTALRFAVKRASSPMEKLLLSAVANAKNNGVDNPENLYIVEMRVDKGTVLKRFMPRARGNAAQILKRSSNVILTLGEKPLYGKALAKAPKATKAKKDNK
jgi:large subunit ribosomal protein L22